MHQLGGRQWSGEPLRAPSRQGDPADRPRRRAVKALAEAVEHATDRYRQGLASYYEVLEAQQQLYPAQNTLAQIRRNRLLAYVQLYNALGGGWSLTDAEWTSQDEARTR